MLDFLSITEEDFPKPRNGDPYIEVSPGFIAAKTKDLMVRGGSLYAVWDEEAGLWRTSIYDVIRLVDKELDRHVEGMPPERRTQVRVKYMRHEGNLKISNFLRHVRNLDDWYEQLDQKVIFSDTVTNREDYATQKLSYPLHDGTINAYKEMMTVLFDEDELRKLEWGVGAIISGEAKHIQKFMVLYGAPGTGKSTFIDLVELLFEFYARPFRSKDLGDVNRQFALSSFKESPLVAFEHEGNLSKIQDNSNLNSVISHDLIEINEKHKTPYTSRINAFLFIGSNKQVKISDAYSGLLRRLIDVHPTGKIHTIERYETLKEQMGFELGAIARHCRDVFLELGRNYYNGYRPTRMMFGTNALHNFVDHYYIEFSEAEYVTLTQAFDWYKSFMDESNERFILTRTEFREEFRAYFEVFEDRSTRFGDRVRNVFHGFKKEMFEKPEVIEKAPLGDPITETESKVDIELADCPAQYANSYETPSRKWREVTTTLKDLDTTKLHYVKPPLNHIVIDFDLSEDGKKSREKNLEAAMSWPPTYTEWSKGGAGLHLHYNYVGDAERLSRVYAPGIEVKVFVGDASLRRKLSTCNSLDVATITSGLPLREEKVIDVKEVKSELGLRRLIEKNLLKLVHPGTKPSMDFIHKILNDAYKSGLTYDLTDMKPRVVGFAMNSTNQSIYCLKLVDDIPFKSESEPTVTSHADDDRIVFFDVEVFPNLFVVCWKYEDAPNVVRMINPTPAEMEPLFKLKLSGFNNRRYDNHILYARYMGYNLYQLYELSQRMINKERSPFAMAYGISYCDIYDYSSKKQSLKKWQIELGIKHLELGIPWDEPVPDELVDTVAEYCANDVESTEVVHKHLHADFVARQILAELSGLPVNSSSNQHSARIIFGEERKPHKDFVYTDLSERFPGYEFSFGKSKYRDMDPSEGGFVYAEPGMYSNVTVADVAGMHPASIIALNLFGDKYTPRFKELVDARLAIKHGDYSEAGKMLGGRIGKYLSDPTESKGLSNALKIVVNSVYGLTSASFDNPFRDIRNIDNIVAKRGALFMIDLLHAVKEKGYQVVHIKTDSIKVVDMDDELRRYIFEFGESYGYTFEVEAEYEKFTLVNDAVYIALEKGGGWEAVGAQFKHPVVYKTLFTKETLEFDDYVEVKSVKTSMWLDYGEGKMNFAGRVGAFVPVLTGGGDLVRKNDRGGFDSVVGAKGFKWKEAEEERHHAQGRYDNLDMSYFDQLCNKAIAKLAEHGDPEWMLG